MAADIALCDDIQSAMSRVPHVLFQYIVVNVRVSLFIFKATAGNGFLQLAGTIFWVLILFFLS
jgi:hypothetical protein